MDNPNLITLRERFDWLRAVANLKNSLGHNSQQEQREADALGWAIDILEAVSTVAKRHDV